jgi:hypothetical protein
MRYRLAFLITITALVTGCATTPQSREEMKASVVQHTSFGLMDTYIVNRSLENVAASLERKWRECYDVNVTTNRATSSGITTSHYSDVFHPQFRRVGTTKVEMTLQSTTTGMKSLNKVPEGGEYQVVLDLDRLPANRTKMTWYSWRIGMGEQLDINKQWANGKDAPCP